MYTINSLFLAGCRKQYTWLSTQSRGFDGQKVESSSPVQASWFG